MVANRHIALKVKNPVYIPKAATYQGKRKALIEFVPQFASVAIEAALPRRRLGKISGVKTHITAQIDKAITREINRHNRHDPKAKRFGGWQLAHPLRTLESQLGRKKTGPQ